MKNLGAIELTVTFEPKYQGLYDRRMTHKIVRKKFNVKMTEGHIWCKKRKRHVRVYMNRNARAHAQTHTHTCMPTK